MNPQFTKSFASLLVGVMSLLGWNTPDNAILPPPKIQPTVQIPHASGSTTPQNKIATPNKKKIKTKPIVRQKKSISTPPQVTLTKEPVQKTPPPQIQIPPAPTTPIQKLEPTIAPPLSPEEKVKQSTVNILCSMIKGNFIQKMTGSGVVIDPQGIIVTNAHVAEHLLLEEAGKESCLIRTGSPAKDSYKAKIIYLPTTWIANNKNNLSITNAMGTGENDYALLVLTERVSTNGVDVPLPYLTPATIDPTAGQDIILAGYPANFGDIHLLDTALYQLEKISKINQVMTFDGTSIGAINTPPTVLAEHGSSGGAMASADGTLLGIIDATTVDNYSGQKNIQGITLQYIRKSILQNSGKSFDYFLNNARDEANNFQKEKVQDLANILLGN